MERQFLLKSHPLLLWAYLLLLFAVIVMNTLFQLSLDLEIIIAFIFFLFLYLYEFICNRHIMRQFIQNCDHIIDQEPLYTIQGETAVAVLSSKLDILNQRYQAALRTHETEKSQLKKSLDHVSHQLKTPLTAIKINAELLLLSSLSNDEQKLLKDLIAQTNHLSYLVEQLLKLSKTNADAVTYHFAQWRFSDIFSELENTLSPLLLKSQVQLNYPMDDTFFYCDQIWLLEALENIIKNCVEHAPSRPIDITIAHGEFMHRIEIQDHGNGFEIENPNQIFTQFYHGKNSQGAGIGLALAKEIIRAHHGKINAYNHQGALFVIELPIYYTKENVNVTE